MNPPLHAWRAKAALPAAVLAAALPAAVLAAALLAGCAARPAGDQGHAGDEGRAGVEGRAARAGAGAREAGCAQLLASLDRELAAAGVADAQEARIEGFPALRVDRLLASALKPAPDDPAFPAWAGQLRARDQAARAHELANLPRAAREQVAGAAAAAGVTTAADAQRLAATVADCGDALLRTDLARPERRAALHRNARVPDAYVGLQRVLGLYPLTALPMRLGIANWHAQTRSVYATPLAQRPVLGRLVRYGPPAATSLGAEEVAAILARSAANPLRLPQPAGADRERLLAAFAPVFEVDTLDDNDRIGAPAWGAGELPRVDVTQPIVYTRLSHARLAGQTLLQLNYFVWFPARPLDGPLDLLGGHLDGITWRVSLGADGRPLMWDSMHPCGCYHLFVPNAARLRQVSAGGLYDEPPLVPQALHDPAGRLVLRVAARTHDLERVSAEPAEAAPVRYRFEPYEQLRSLARPDGTRRSLFGPDGIVPGSQRAERWLFWPMGVPDPGAMRQWGHHATAFVGRRHFDDPDLLERYFAPGPTGTPKD